MGTGLVGKNLVAVSVAFLFVATAATVSGYSSEKQVSNGTGEFAAEGFMTLRVIVVPRDYPTIQDAVDHANEGDIIRIWAGVYRENIRVYKTLSIIGNGSSLTVVDGMGRDDVVRVTADGVELRGFTIRNSGSLNTGVHLFSHYNVIQGNKIIDNGHGVRLSSSNSNNIGGNNISNNILSIYLYLSNSTSVNGNNISDNGNGIYLSSSNGNSIGGNNFTNNGEGVLLSSSNGNSIIGNNISNNTLSIYLVSSNSNNIGGNNISNNTYEGIFLGSSNGNSISGNIISNTSFGIYLRSSNGNSISGNIISNTSFGIYLRSSNGNSISGNIISSNTHGIYLCSSISNEIHRNNFIENRVHARFLHARFLDSFLNCWNGNFWDNWISVGPKIILGGVIVIELIPFPWFNFDWYPLKEPV